MFFETDDNKKNPTKYFDSIYKTMDIAQIVSRNNCVALIFS